MTDASPPVEPAVLDVRHRDGKVEIDLHIVGGLFVLQGHFPQFPVVPGVAQIDWALCFARCYLGTTQQSAQRFSVKFRSIIRPDIRVTLELELSVPDAAGVKRLIFSYRRGADLCSSGQIWLEPTG